MTLLTDQQRKGSVEVMQEYVSAPAGPDGLQRLFTNSGVVTGNDVRQFFM